MHIESFSLNFYFQGQDFLKVEVMEVLFQVLLNRPPLDI